MSLPGWLWTAGHQTDDSGCLFLEGEVFTLGFAQLPGQSNRILFKIAFFFSTLASEVFQNIGNLLKHKHMSCKERDSQRNQDSKVKDAN